MFFLRKSSAFLVALLLILSACGSGTIHITKKEAHTYQVKSITPDSSLTALIKPYKDELDTKMSEVIGRAETTLTKKQPECTLGNFIADVQLQAALNSDSYVDVSITNYGGIRVAYLQEGNILLRNIYELMPFDNSIVILEIPGSMLHLFCDHMASLKGWPVSGLTYTIKDKKAENILINEEPLVEERKYKIATSDYLANGGDNCDFLKSFKPVITNILIRDALVTYIRDLKSKNKPLSAKLENRVTNAE